MNDVIALMVFVAIAFVMIVAERKLYGRPQRNTPKEAKEVVVARSRRAVLIRDENGKMFCICPYACLATHEECEFADWKEKK